jgi:hypothetical protein
MEVALPYMFVLKPTCPGTPLPGSETIPPHRCPFFGTCVLAIRSAIEV